MTKTAALSEATRRWGRAARVRFIADAPLASDRPALIAERDRIKAVEPPAGDPTKPAWRQSLAKIRSQLMQYRCTVGHVDVIAGLLAVYHVEGQGDTWEEAFAKVR